MTHPLVSAIVLTYNEEENLEACLSSLAGVADDIHLIDSGSTDGTLKIAEKHTKHILANKFVNQAEQLNWALDKIKPDSSWMLRLDADERLSPELAEELRSRLPSATQKVSGFYLKRRVYFMGAWIKYGGYYPTWLLRVWRNGKARAENRWMDEHMLLSEGQAGMLTNDIIEENKKNLNFWIGKHNSYASREAIEELKFKYGITTEHVLTPDISGAQDSRKRWIKTKLYFRLPLFFRAFAYFIYRYFFRFGFLDGKEGLIFHFLQGFWYRFLVDAKIYEIKRTAERENKPVEQVIANLYGIKI